MRVFFLFLLFEAHWKVVSVSFLHFHVPFCWWLAKVWELWADLLTPCLAFLNLVLSIKMCWMPCHVVLSHCCVIPCLAVLTCCYVIPALPLSAKLCSWSFPQFMLLTHRRNWLNLVWRFWSEKSSGVHIFSSSLWVLTLKVKARARRNIYGRLWDFLLFRHLQVLCPKDLFY